MAPLKPVKSLFDFSLDSVVKKICKKYDEEEFEVVREHLISILPGSIRTSIIEQALSSPEVHDRLTVVALIGDPAIKKLCVTRKENIFCWSQCKQLFSTLHTSNITGLHELHLREVYGWDGNGTTECVDELEIVGGLHKALSQGLASSLRVLCLHTIAENKTLKLIGSEAVHLAQLDVTGSWFVDDSGIIDLLIKDPTGLPILPWPDLESRNLSAIETLSQFPVSKLNRTSDTLYEVKIQETNTSAISVIILLMFAKKLESFGGFLYDRNIGDTVLSVQARKNAPPHLSLTQLWDMDLPKSKLEKLVKSLPKLRRVYTRMTWLPKVPNVIPPLTHLIVDFDFVHYGEQFFNFLNYYGETIKQLLLIDQVYRLDLLTIASYCPQLEVLSAKVDVESLTEKKTPLLHNLKTAEVRISSPQTFLWLMKHAENIKHLVVIWEYGHGIQDWFEINAIRNLVNENPKSLSSLTHLSLQLDCLGNTGAMQIEAAELLCSACDSLHILGELDTWFQVSLEDVERMAVKIKMSNWDVKLVYKNNFYPAS